MTRLDLAALAVGLLSVWSLVVWIAYRLDGETCTARQAICLWALETWRHVWRIPETPLPEWPYVRSWAERVAAERLRPFEEERRGRLHRYFRATVALQARRQVAAKAHAPIPMRREASGR